MKFLGSLYHKPVFNFLLSLVLIIWLYVLKKAPFGWYLRLVESTLLLDEGACVHQ
jgi:hypothetical protein